MAVRRCPKCGAIYVMDQSFPWCPKCKAPEGGK